MNKTIKILAAIGLFTIILSLCSFVFYNTNNSHDSRIELCEYKLNGHYYVAATKISYNSGVGIIHSPNCKCEKK